MILYFFIPHLWKVKWICDVCHHLQLQYNNYFDINHAKQDIVCSDTENNHPLHLHSAWFTFTALWAFWSTETWRFSGSQQELHAKQIQTGIMMTLVSHDCLCAKATKNGVCYLIVWRTGQILNFSRSTEALQKANSSRNFLRPVFSQSKDQIMNKLKRWCCGLTVLAPFGSCFVVHERDLNQFFVGHKTPNRHFRPHEAAVFSSPLSQHQTADRNQTQR